MNQLLSLLVVLTGLLLASSANAQSNNTCSFKPFLDIEHIVGLEANLIRNTSKKFYQNIGIGVGTKNMSANISEAFKIKFLIGFRVSNRVHLATGVKSGLFNIHKHNQFYHFWGNETGLFIDLKKIELGTKISTGFDFNSPKSGIKTNVLYALIRVPLYKATQKNHNAISSD